MQPIKQWLDRLGLVRYAEVFAENDIDLEALRGSCPCPCVSPDFPHALVTSLCGFRPKTGSTVKSLKAVTRRCYRPTAVGQAIE